MSMVLGDALSLLLFRYTGASVARTFFITAAAFGAPGEDALYSAVSEGGRRAGAEGSVVDFNRGGTPLVRKLPDVFSVS